MRTFVEKNYFVHFIGLILFLSSCSGPSGGFAPSMGVVVPPAQQVFYSESFMNLGQSVTNAQGWTAEANVGEPVKNSLLGTGWSVEVRYE